MQGWDYRLGINGIKRMQSAYNSALVAQGAFSAYWTDDLRAVGGWPDAIGEDIVLTWTLMDKRGIVQYEPTAVGFTLVPERFRRFMNQRSRWARGMIEAIPANPPHHQPRVLAKLIAGIDYLVPLIDIGYIFFWVPGAILFIFGYTLIVSWWSMLVIPVTIIVYGLLRRWQERWVFNRLGIDVNQTGEASSATCSPTRRWPRRPRFEGTANTSPEPPVGGDDRGPDVLPIRTSPTVMTRSSGDWMSSIAEPRKTSRPVATSSPPNSRRPGEAEAAADVKRQKRPTQAASVVNRLSLDHPDETQALLDAAEAAPRRSLAARHRGLRRASARGRPEEREALERLMEIAREMGPRPSAATLDRVGETLQAAGSDEEVARLVRTGRLDRERRAAGLPGGATPTRSRAATKPAKDRSRELKAGARRPQGAAPSREAHADRPGEGSAETCGRRVQAGGGAGGRHRERGRARLDRRRDRRQGAAASASGGLAALSPPCRG